MKKALVIEDQHPVREALGDLLKVAGFDVKLVGDGHAAFDDLQVTPYDLVTLDLNMPSLDGVSLAESLAQDDGPNSATPVIVISAYLNESTMDTLRPLGITHFFPKPFDVDALIETVHALTDTSKS